MKAAAKNKPSALTLAHLLRGKWVLIGRLCQHCVRRANLWDARSINDDKVAVRLGKGRHQTPYRHARRTAFFSHELTLLVIKLPGHSPTFGPTRAFRPGEERLPLVIGNGDRML